MKVLTVLKSGRGGLWAIQQLEQLSRYDIESVIAVPEGRTAEAARLLPRTTVHAMQGATEPSNTEVVRTWPARLRTLIETTRPALIHSHFVATTLAARLALRRRRPPVVFQVPGPLHLESKWTRQLDVRSARRIDHWIAGCEASATHLRAAGIGGDRCAVAYYAGDVGRWEQLPSPSAEGRALLPVNRTIVGMVAYTYPPRRRFGGRGLKGHEDFIAALRILLGRGVPVHGLLIGGAWDGAEEYHARLQSLARAQLGEHHTWVPTVSDVLPWYRLMDMAVHPSLSENLGGAAESMRAGVATIATNVGGFPDLIPDATCGRLVPASDPDRLAAAIEQFVTDPLDRASTAARGRQQALDLLDPERNAALVWHALGRAAR